MFNQDECGGVDILLEASFGDTKSNRRRFGPGSRCTRALKCDSTTGHAVAGKLSWW